MQRCPGPVKCCHSMPGPISCKICMFLYFCRLGIFNAYSSMLEENGFMILPWQTGEKVLDYINRIRLQEAKQLLQKCEINIEEVARKTGFNNSIALIRVFKKYEGITPGKYKDTMKQNHVGLAH